MSTLLWALLSGCVGPSDWLTDPRPVDSYALDFAVDPALIEEVSFETDDGVTLAGVWLQQPVGAPPLVVFHSGQNLDAHAARVEHLWSWGVYDVLIFDYRGHGRSEGVADFAATLTSDGAAAARYAAESVNISPNEVPWVAFSMGSTVALHTAAIVGPRAIAAEGAPLDLQEWVDAASGLELPPAWAPELDFNNEEAIAEVTAPVYLIRGSLDPIVAYESSAALQEAAGGGADLWVPEGVGHDDILQVIPEDYRDRVFPALNAR